MLVLLAHVTALGLGASEYLTSIYFQSVHRQEKIFLQGFLPWASVITHIHHVLIFKDDTPIVQCYEHTNLKKKKISKACFILGNHNSLEH